MSLRRYLSTDRKAEADQSSMENDRTPPYNSNVKAAPIGRDSLRQPGSSLSTDTRDVAEKYKVALANPNYSKCLSFPSQFSFV